MHINENYRTKLISIYLDPYDLREGFTCDTNYTPLISRWQDCKTAAESLGFIGDKVAHVDYKNPAWGTTRPRGCFQAYGNNRFHFNEAAGGGAINGTWGTDKILCIRKDLGSRITIESLQQ